MEAIAMITFTKDNKETTILCDNSTINEVVHNLIVEDIDHVVKWMYKEKDNNVWV